MSLFIQKQSQRLALPNRHFCFIRKQSRQHCLHRGGWGRGGWSSGWCGWFLTIQRRYTERARETDCAQKIYESVFSVQEIQNFTLRYLLRKTPYSSSFMPANLGDQSLCCHLKNSLNGHYCQAVVLFSHRSKQLLLFIL
jgi:hypothetical protein